MHLKLNKIRMEEERLYIIERDNRVLLEKMSHTMRTKGRIDNVNKYALRSLNKINRQQELLRITKENKALMERILKRKPELDRSQWEKDWQRNLGCMENLTNYPDEFKTEFKKFTQPKPQKKKKPRSSTSYTESTRFMSHIDNDETQMSADYSLNQDQTVNADKEENENIPENSANDSDLQATSDKNDFDEQLTENVTEQKSDNQGAEENEEKQNDEKREDYESDFDEDETEKRSNDKSPEKVAVIETTEEVKKEENESPGYLKDSSQEKVNEESKANIEDSLIDLDDDNSGQPNDVSESKDNEKKEEENNLKEDIVDSPKANIAESSQSPDDAANQEKVNSLEENPQSSKD